MRPPLPSWQAVTAAGSAILLMLFALTAFDALGQASLWENAHWTWASLMAAALGGIAIARSPRHRGITAWLAAGSALTLAGMITFDVVVVDDAFTIPAAYDPIFLLSYPLMLVGLGVAARRVLSNADAVVFLIDSAIALVVVALLMVTIFDATIAQVGGMSAFLLIAYPVVFLGTAVAVILAGLELNGHSSGPGLGLIALGSMLVGLDWSYWLLQALDGPPDVGSVLNYVWSVGVVLVGIGAVTWRFTPSAALVADRLRLVRGLVPVAAVIVSIAILVWFEPSLHAISEQLIAIAIVLTMVRQTLLLVERERVMAREVKIATDMDTQRQIAQDALAAQLASEKRYRSTVEVFAKLGDQLGFARDEADLLRAATAALARLCPSDAGELLVVSPSQDRLVVSQAWGDRRRETGSELDDVPTRCFGIRRGSVYLVDDVTNDLTLPCPVHSARRGSVMCVPLIALGDMMGVAHLERAEANSFSADAAREAARVAEQVALAVANARMLKTLESMALTDPMTRLHNARFFDPFLDRELATAARDGEPLALVMIDLDHFKQFNDTHGHAAGDEALRVFSRAVLSVARDSDTVARYGGEEFVVAARHADLKGGVALAERMRAAVERSPVELAPGRFARISASFGVASTAANGVDRLTLMKAADAALYRAKHNGRNRVEAARPATGARPRRGRQAASERAAG